MKKMSWNYYYIRSAISFGYERIFHSKIKLNKYKQKYIGGEEFSTLLQDKIKSNSAFVATRFGAFELNMLRKIEHSKIVKNGIWGGYKEKVNNVSKRTERSLKQFCSNAGFFPDDLKMAEKYYELIIKLLPEVDVLAEWDLPMEEYFIKHYINNASITQLGYLEPWNMKSPWTQALQGKNVLVIHPFAKSIANQYKQRKRIFDDESLLPEFNLICLKAVQTIAGEKDGRFHNWFEALEYMYLEALKINFDVVIVGCGAYGMPLALKLKKEGKTVIHMGGALQLLFGIKGKRWNEFPLINNYWVEPLEEEKPLNAKSIENGCYW